ncbi:hypothetical protein BD626DRAFT_566865 [Schizophyllum amplum]|uniref:Cora-like Mg2+ transporter protein-domain-containing protein n=1 Tax=Schizophyllum amplum TaxID=97359 RepID=A0A550CN60_9AGAR|nr:hypothetical protein BD626DRAFT_566865 [Auriculariopsis ampla]
MDNEEFIDFMNTSSATEKREGSPPEHWTERDKPAPFRWISITGIDWGVMSSLALRYDLHALALEDVLQEQGFTHSKADYYNHHLHLRILAHSLAPDDEFEHSRWWMNEARQPDIERDPNSSLFQRGLVGKARRGKLEIKRRLGLLSGYGSHERERQILRLQALTKGERVNVRREPLYVFLLRDGTVISINPTRKLHFTRPLMERLRQKDSVLRTSEDPSMLVESIIDLVVDRILDLMDSYQDKIHRLEQDVLLRSNGMSTVRSLHIISGDLAMHKRTLEPIKHLIFGLRRYDHERCIAVANMDAAYDAEAGDGHTAFTLVGGQDGGSQGDFRPPNPQTRPLSPMRGSERRPSVKGYMSYKSKIYLADVYDHVHQLRLTSVEMFDGTTENLINFAFNSASYDMNDSMRRLNVAAVVFLPLTLLTGYFGMNFADIADLKSMSLFWIVAIPVMVVLLPVFAYSDIRNAIRYMKKTMEMDKASKYAGRW